MITVRTYSDNDFQNILELMIRNNELDSFSATLLREKLYDDPAWNPDSTLIAQKGNMIVGFMQGVLREIGGTRYGYIKLMAVEKEFCRTGIATQLYSELEKWFIKNGVKNVRIYDVPLNYFMPGIDPRYTPAVCFAQKMGFVHKGDACNMTVNLNDSDWDTRKQTEKLKKENIDIARANPKDQEELFEFIAPEWILWKNELEMAYRSVPPTIFIARKDGCVKAFAAYDGNNIGTGWFGPMGTDHALRGKGVGTILLYLCLADMKRKGLQKSTIPWVAPIGFYSHYANARIERVFWRFEKNLNYK